MKLRVKMILPRLLLVTTLVSGAVSCTFSNPSVEKNTLFLQLSGEPVTLDPSLVEDGLGFRVVVNLMDGLMGFSSTGELQSRLAREVHHSSDKRSLTFRIRENATWSDGQKITADQIIFAIERALRPQTGSKLSGLLWDIEGAEAFVAGKATTVSGLKAEGDTLTVYLKRPVSYMVEVFALPITYPLRKDILEKTGGKWDPLRDSNVPTSGAYRVEKYQRDQQIQLRAAREIPERAPKSVVLRIVQDESTGASLFEQGKLDILTRIPAYEQAKYEKLGQVRVVPFLATYFLSFNFKKEPFKNREYRRAVAGAIRRLDLVKALGTGETATTSWIPPTLEGHMKPILDPQGRDPRFHSSVEFGKKHPPSAPIVMGFDTSGRNSMVMEKVQADLRETLGWKTELRNSDWKTMVKEIFTDPPPIYRYGWSSPMKDPIIFLSAFQTKDPFSFSGYSNPEYDRRVDEIRSLSPGTLRTKKIQEAQRLLVETEAVIVPLYHYVSTFAVGPRVEKYDVNPYGHTRFEEVVLRTAD